MVDADRDSVRLRLALATSLSVTECDDEFVQLVLAVTLVLRVYDTACVALPDPLRLTVTEWLRDSVADRLAVALSSAVALCV